MIGRMREPGGHTQQTHAEADMKHSGGETGNTRERQSQNTLLVTQHWDGSKISFLCMLAGMDWISTLRDAKVKSFADKYTPWVKTGETACLILPVSACGPFPL